MLLARVCVCALRAQYSAWTKVAAENFAAAKAKAKGAVAVRIGAADAGGTGAERGAAVAEELLFGNARYLEGGAEPSVLTRAQGPLATPAAVVVCLTPLPAEAHVLLGCDAASLFVVPCTPAGIETLVLGNVEHGVIGL